MLDFSNRLVQIVAVSYNRLETCIHIRLHLSPQPTFFTFFDNPFHMNVHHNTKISCYFLFNRSFKPMETAPHGIKIQVTVNIMTIQSFLFYLPLFY